MDVKHTPGPWVFGRTSDDKRLILGEGATRYVATVQIHQTPRKMGLWMEDEREANARLIAAAPDLLEAAVKLVGHPDLGTIRYTDGDMWKDAEALRAAIAKAEGRD